MDRKKIMANLSESLVRVNSAYEKIAFKYQISYNSLMIFYLLDDTTYLTQKDICEKLFLSKSTVNGLLKDLKTKGYVELIPGKNKKEKCLILTDSGKIINQHIQEDTDSFETGILHWFGEEKIASFLESAENISWQMYNTVKDSIK